MALMWHRADLFRTVWTHVSDLIPMRFESFIRYVSYSWPDDVNENAQMGDHVAFRLYACAECSPCRPACGLGLGLGVNVKIKILRLSYSLLSVAFIYSNWGNIFGNVASGPKSG